MTEIITTRKSNIERGKWRGRCRRELSKHIYNRLGLSVEPSQIRLNPNATDGYNWKILPEKVEHLSSIFSKKLSDQSVGAYKELFNGVGSNFEAVAAMQTAQYRTGPDSSVSLLPDASFSAKIARLEDLNHRLRKKLQQCEASATASSEYCQKLENDLNLSREAQETLREQVHKYEKIAAALQVCVSKYADGLAIVLPVLEELGSLPSL